MMDKNKLKSLREETRQLFDTKFGDIVFEEVPHRYTIDGVEYTPVSTIISQYENEFDSDLRSKSYAEKNGLTQEEVLRSWKWTNRCATIMGTRAHEYGESYTNLMCGHPELICQQNKAQYVEEENWLVPTFPQEFAVKSFYDELNKNLHPIGAEFKLSTQYIKGAKPICGTADILFYYDAPDPKNSGFCIFDWKGLDINVPILTEKGWKTMGTVEVGDIVYDKEGKKCKVLHTSEVHHRKCYEITFNNNDKIIADNEHRWLITFGDAASGLKDVVMTSEEIHSYLQQFKNSKISPHKIPKIYNAKPIINDNIQLPIDPYVLGCWLCGGYKLDGIIKNKEYGIWLEITRRGYEIGEDIPQNGDGNDKGEILKVFGLRSKLIEMGLLGNKHIPDIYMNSSFEQRLDLLRGLMDMDGYYDEERNCFGMNTSQEWKARAIRMIASSLGFKVTITKSEGDGIDITFNGNINPFLVKHHSNDIPKNNAHEYREIVSVEEVETIPTRCIEVDSPTHTFLCGENFLVTHNTNKELTKDFVRNTGLMMKPPFDNMYDEALSHYYLQFNLYQRMMESIGLKIIARRLVHLKRDGTYEVHTVPKIDDSIIDQVIMK